MGRIEPANTGIGGLGQNASHRDVQKRMPSNWGAGNAMPILTLFRLLMLVNKTSSGVVGYFGISGLFSRFAFRRATSPVFPKTRW